MNNCQSHKSKNTNRQPNTISFENYFLSTYSPDMTPEELRFAFINQSFMKIWKVKNVNLKVENQK